MKRFLVVLSLVGIVAIVSISVSIAKNALVGEKLSSAQAEKRWGGISFRPDVFKSGSVQTRASMAADIVKRKSFLGVSVEEVEKALGKHDAYFKNDFIPAYALNEGWKTGEDTWQLVFLPDRELKIVDVFINKNCCKR